MNRNIFIVGGAGFVGKTLAKHFVKDFDVTIIDAQPCPKELGSNVSYVHCDIRDFQAVVKGLKGADLVIHTAIVQIPLINEKKQLGYEVNVLGTQNLCKAVEEDSRIKGIIIAGTWHTIGERNLKGTIDEEFGLDLIKSKKERDLLLFEKWLRNRSFDITMKCPIRFMEYCEWAQFLATECLLQPRLTFL